jgi:hypothetical protein
VYGSDRGFFNEENVEACKQDGVKSARNRLPQAPIPLWTDRAVGLAEERPTVWPLPGMAVDRSNLRWAKGGVEWALYCHGRKEPLLHVIRDAHYPEMWRVKLPDGRHSDMVNLSRAKDSAATIAIAQAAKETGLGNSPRGQVATLSGAAIRYGFFQQRLSRPSAAAATISSCDGVRVAI